MRVTSPKRIRNTLPDTPLEFLLPSQTTSGEFAAGPERSIESGNHDQLMAGGGLYAKLYGLNYASFDDIPEEELESAAQTESRT